MVTVRREAISMGTVTRYNRSLLGWLFIEASGYCTYCGVDLTRRLTEATVDHVQPKGVVGHRPRHNVVLSCRTCNELKGCYDPIDLEDARRHIQLERERREARYAPAVRHIRHDLQTPPSLFALRICQPWESDAEGRLLAVADAAGCEAINLSWLLRKHDLGDVECNARLVTTAVVGDVLAAVGKEVAA